MRRCASLVVLVLALAGCATSPTGRDQIRLYSDREMARMGSESFAELKREGELVRDPAVTGYVRCVAGAITETVAPGQDWEVQVFERDAANAFALPGGKIGVYAGMLEVARGPDQLAAVLAHEVAHVEAEHGNARMSAATMTQVGIAALQIALGGEGRDSRQTMALLGLGAQVGILLPYGRSQESEADALGLDYMARAGFDPRASVELWQNMARRGGSAPPEFLSTHPSHASRIEDLRARMPQALERYRAARERGRVPRCEPPASA
ncbi:MAG: M48 family metalloprotease [Halofilum sp. (in: g-proteobacteria)]|nr:M48 family metalloprotease [Halofilum sp. (in: g-proteobacteria)]